MPFEVDALCECGHVRTLWLENREADPDSEDAKCPECGSFAFRRLLGGNFASYASSDRSTQMATLKKRSEDHSRATFKDNYDRVRSRLKK